MSEESNLINKSDDTIFENMKVIELKKKLKFYGLPTTGNKSDLIERLQEAMISGKEMDLDASLLNDSNEAVSALSALESTTDDISLSSPEKDSPKETLQKAVDSTTNSSPAAVPLKKRAVTQAPNETVKVEKRIVLKRNNIPTPKFIPSKPAVPIKRISVITEAKSEINKLDDKKECEVERKDVSGTVIRLSGSSTKGLSELEKIQLRAKRFNIEPTHKPIKFSEAVKQNVISNISSNTVSTSSNQMPDFDAKTKRALRFGFNVSKTLRKLEQQEVMLKRKSKFGGGNGVVDSDEQEKKKKRAERFGL